MAKEGYEEKKFFDGYLRKGMETLKFLKIYCIFKNMFAKILWIKNLFKFSKKKFSSSSSKM
jgi:ABC-type glucose/galactose transport system permease subunit